MNKMQALTASSILISLMAGCAQRDTGFQQYLVQSQKKEAEQADRVNSALAAQQSILTKLNAIPARDCSADKWELAVYPLGVLDGLAGVQKVSVDYPNPATYTKDVQSYRQFVAYGLQTRLQIADKALKEGCLDRADTGYRDILARYIGGDYSSYRQRAQVGIDDVRAARDRK